MISAFLSPGTDFITCLITIPYTLVFEIIDYKIYYDLACKTYMFFITSTVPFSAYIMVAIAFDRYFCICHPFLHAFTIPRAKIVILSMLVPAVTFGMITAFSFGTYVVEELYIDVLTGNGTVTSTTTYSEVLKDFSKNNRSVQIEYLHNTSLVVADRTSHIAHQDLCLPNNFHFSPGFSQVYKRVHALNFLVAYLAVAVLYILIYKSIFTRRANKARRKKNNLYPTSAGKLKDDPQEETQMTVIPTAAKNSPKLMNNQTSKDAKCARKITLTARNDPAAVNKSGSRKSSGTIPAIPEIQEDERTNLLYGNEETKAEGAENANTSNTTSSTTDESKNVYDGEDVTNTESDKNAEQGHSENEASKYLAETKHNGFAKTSELTTREVNFTEVDTTGENSNQTPDTFKNNNTNEDETATDGIPNGAMPEEKPLLTPPPPVNQPPHPSPPTTLSLKPNLTADKSFQNDAKNAATSKKHSLAKQDVQNNSIKRKRPSTVRDRNLMANIKTAFMLFIVTLVFLIAFLPALLMANEIVTMNLNVFYSYFIYNVANPFIYAFMNQTFREDLKKIIGFC
ncbi:uncharacterized protein LOC131947196 [Physella acuta]|uniref:uncharacterized protein LOC131947196 n=1 Tax=Physella acuta TaxID=109671 RepID=UPI0027DD3E05|nr:uncharacterized protein LOC131947196 [Physella acuta]